MSTKRCALAMALVFCAAAQTTPDRYQQKLQPVLEKLIQEQELPGFAVGVVENNRLAYAAGFGVRNVTRKDDPITTRSLFHMASITKTFVATSIMQLVENGKIDLNAPVVKYLPYFRMADDRYTTITVRQMVTHISGMPDVEDYEWAKPQYDEGALERYVRSLSNLKLEFAPGERFQYSNMAFEILGDVIAKVSGESFDDYVQHHILTPLGMKDSTLLVKQADPKLLAWGHELNETGDPFPSKVYPYNRIHSPSSDLHSNVVDMARWAIANMNRGELDGARILKASTYDVMWKPSGEFGGKPAPTGISWFLGEHRGNKMVSHNGGDTGFLTGLAMLPEKKIAVVWMTNAEWLPNTGAVTNAALDVALGLEPQPITGKRSVAEAMFHAYEGGGIDAAIKQYEVLKKVRPDAYNFGVGQLNRLGRYLVSKGRAKEAIRVFQLNAAAYPTVANTFDALGDAYEKDGNRALAVSNYQKALELDPKQAHAAEALKRLKDGAQSTIRPGEPWPDDHGQHVQAHGGGILKLGDTWYWFGEDRSQGLDPSRRYVSCYSSKDLAHWTFRNQVMKQADPGDLGPRFVLERPKVFYNAKTKKYVMYMHIDDARYAVARVGVAVSDTVDGDYQYLKSFRPLGQESRDIGQFIDDDGAAYLIFEDRPAKGFHIAKLSDDYLTVEKDVCLIRAPLEGGAVVHYQGLYYALGSALTGWNPNPNKYASAAKLEGPWSEFRDIAPPEAKTYGSQSTMLLKIVGSRTTSVIFMGDIWKPRTQWDSRYLWMPVEIGDGKLWLPEPKAWTLDVRTGEAVVGK